MYLIRFILLTFFLFYYTSLFAKNSSELDKLYDKTIHSIFKLNVYNYDLNRHFEIHGTFIDSKGYLITNDFAFLGNAICYLTWIDENMSKYTLSSQLVSIHPEYKAALLKIEHPTGGKFSFTPISTNSPKIGEWVMRLSINRKGEAYLGEVLYETPNELEKVVGMGCYGKDLGAPYFNLNGEVIGVHNQSKERKSFFTDFTAIKDWIEFKK